MRRALCGPIVHIASFLPGLKEVIKFTKHHNEHNDSYK
jgi:hypothetical protein